MERAEFIKEYVCASNVVDKDELEDVIARCIERNSREFPEDLHNHMLGVSMMEECGELIQAISHKIRGRAKDDYDILQESADVILDILCICRSSGISDDMLKKAINVKIRREMDRQK